MSKSIVSQYYRSIEARKQRILSTIDDKKQNWLFGASNFSQPLFVYGLPESSFAGILDNSPLKHGKRLYGTRLVCRKPESVVLENKGRNPLRIFLNIGTYNQEVREQLKALDPTIEFIEL